MKVLLDTHILVWWVNGDQALSVKQGAVLARIAASRPSLVADITLWEGARDFANRQARQERLAPPHGRSRQSLVFSSILLASSST